MGVPGVSGKGGGVMTVAEWMTVAGMSIMLVVAIVGWRLVRRIMAMASGGAVSGYIQPEGKEMEVWETESYSERGTVAEAVKARIEAGEVWHLGHDATTVPEFRESGAGLFHCSDGYVAVQPGSVGKGQEWRVRDFVKFGPAQSWAEGEDVVPEVGVGRLSDDGTAIEAGMSKVGGMVRAGVRG